MVTVGRWSLYPLHRRCNQGHHCIHYDCFFDWHMSKRQWFRLNSKVFINFINIMPFLWRIASKYMYVSYDMLHQCTFYHCSDRYVSAISFGRSDAVTLADVRRASGHLDRPTGPRYRFLFKTHEPEFGAAVKEEIRQENCVVPTWEDKIVVWILEASEPSSWRGASPERDFGAVERHLTVMTGFSELWREFWRGAKF